MPAREPERLDASRDGGILDTLIDPAFDRVARLAREVFGMPTVWVSMVDADRQWIRSCVGWELYDPRRELAFCSHTILEERLLVVPDTHDDPRFAGHPFVTGAPFLRFYAGAPIRSVDGLVSGVICLLDTKPRGFSEHEHQVLTHLAAILSDTLALHLAKVCAAKEAEENRQRADTLISNQARSEMAALHLAALVDSSDDAIIGTDLNSIVTSWNQGAQHLFGYAAAEMVGQSTERLLPFERRGEASKILARIRQGEHVDHFDTVRRGKDGRLLNVSIRTSPVRDATGALIGASKIVRDATLRKASENALRQSEANYRELFATNPLPSFAYDLDSLAFLEVNQATVEFYGYSRKELLAMRIVDLFLPVEHPALLAEVATPAAWPVAKRTWLMRKKDGSVAEIEGTGASITFGEHQARLVLVHDMTERNQIEEHRLAKERAERANEAKNEFLSRMSHELRTPLNSILGFSQVLEMETLTASQRSCLHRISAGGRHLLKLINEVLDIARIESGKIVMPLEAVSLEEVLHEALALVAPLAASHGIALDARGFALSETPTLDQATFVWADRQRLKQVLLNLLSNAIKYNVPGGRVTVERAASGPDRLRLRVADTGCGIPVGKRARLFIPFDRLDAERGNVEGTGLGLSLSKCLMEAMGGDLDLEATESDQGAAQAGGAVFWIELPTSEAPLHSATPEDASTCATIQPPAGTHLPAKTVLYIEDNFANLALIERLMEARPRVRLLTAMQGTLGLELAREHRPDLVLLDVHLPDLPGWQVLDALRVEAGTHDVPVIMLSADATERQRDRLLKAGARAYLTKPLDVPKFLKLFDDTLDA